MCDYSLQSVASRPAKVGDKLVVKNFHLGTAGFGDAERDAENVAALRSAWHRTGIRCVGVQGQRELG